ncbi:TlpA disulfide reductase family protein [Butyricimonas sp. Marseille-P3923]|uniref:TlpA disulfide reductase family protein n=1 Tax=Butyricimonas sp. Marseille-P3923 TaxID=1987504 RepID=UPI00159BCA16|nr:TlpA disulfide reductase family protein [Butyricimonas sp. Marseille-P3923]
MKQILYLLILAGAIIAGCSDSGGYVVNGSVGGQVGGKAYAIRIIDKDISDTLQAVDIRDGKFTMKGSVDEITPVYVSVEGGMGSMAYLENGATFTVTFRSGQIPVVEGGGETQRLSLEYAKIGLGLSDKYAGMQEEMMRAFQRGDTSAMKEMTERTRVLVLDSETKQAQFLIDHGNTFFALYDLSQKALGMTADDVKARFDLCSDELKATKPGKYIQELLPKLGKIAIGATVPNFTSRTPDGKEVSLYDIKCKVKLIDFWASNCGICREENQLIKPLYEQYHAKGFDAISYSVDRKREAWLNAVEQDALPWVQVSDLDADKAKVISEMYGVYLLPTTLLVDENNRVIARNVKSDELKELLARLLSGSK